MKLEEIHIYIMKFVFILIMFACLSTTNSVPIAEEETNFLTFYMTESLPLCEDELISLNFSNAVITYIYQDFISSPLISCLNLTGNNIQKIGRGAFNKLPNLTQLFLSDNNFGSELFDFGGHYKLQVLVMNSAIDSDNYEQHVDQTIFDEYPNLEILSLRKNFIKDLYFSPEKISTSESLFAHTTFSTITQQTPFPKLKILDLSENNIESTNFLKLLPNSLYFLDLHNNLLESLNLKVANKLFALNLNNNHFNYIKYNRYDWIEFGTLSVADLKDLHYLSISTNYIQGIEPNAFQDNNKLLYLNLSANNINYLYPEIFANLQYLETLDLSKNKLENIPQISNEIGISTLYINHNNITKLMSHYFIYMPKLTKLLLGQNQINEIEVNAFANLSDLEELDLSKNILSFLPEGWTESLISLKYLDLSDNRFTSLESLSLTNTLSLIKIYLMTNPLEYLNVKYFENLPKNLTINLINKSNFTKWI